MKWAMLLLAASACATPAQRREAIVRERAPFDLNCPNEKIEVQDLGGAVGVRGCGAKATYVLTVGGPVLNTLEKDGQTEIKSAR